MRSQRSALGSVSCVALAVRGLRTGIAHHGTALAAAACATIGIAAAACSASANGPADCEALGRPPIVMVHGSGLSPATWRPLHSALQEAGYSDEAIAAVALQPNDGDNALAASGPIAAAVELALDAAARRARAAGCEPASRVDLVAHSMGAFSARWYAAKLRPERVRILLGVAPSNHGTDALCGHRGTGNVQMCPSFDSTPGSLQARLNGTNAAPLDATPYGLGLDADGAARIAPDATRAIVYLTVRLAEDRWIRPAESAILDGAGGVAWPALPSHARQTTAGNVLWGRAVEHDALPQDPELIDAVVSLLTTAPQQPGN